MAINPSHHETTRVLCVDDHRLLIEGLKIRIAAEPDMEVVGTLSDGDGVLGAVARLEPDVVLLDVEMPGPDPFELASEIMRLHRGTQVLFLTAHVRDHYLTAAFKAGVSGYFSKSDDIAEVIEGIRRAARGEFTLGSSVSERARPRRLRSRERFTAASMGSKIESLTDREQEVLRLIGRGLSRAEIAQSLSRSPKTIDGHRERIMDKLDIHTSPELVRFAIREGLAEV